jgi:hypothetical protein
MSITNILQPRQLFLAFALALVSQAGFSQTINVMDYGAKGDCKTDDNIAIKRAMSAAYPAKTVIFPGKCFLTGSLPYYGVSLQGDSYGGTVLKSLPGQDILATPDPTYFSYSWNRNWSISNLTFVTDNSVHGNFPHRWPGRWFDDGATSSGSAVFKSSAAYITCGDIGQAIKIVGAGPGGKDLVTTIASVSPCWSLGPWKIVKLADPAATTVRNAHSYISLLGLPVTENIGNCAIAFDDLDGNPEHWLNKGLNSGNLYDKMHDVSFYATTTANDSCGIYTQGQWGFYGIDARNYTFRGQAFSIVEGTAELNSFYQSSGNDFQKWDHGSMESVLYPWISYNGGDNEIESLELTSAAGPQILGLANKFHDAPSTWKINIPEFEGNTSPYGLRIVGTSHILTNTVFSENPNETGVADTTLMRCINCSSLGPIRIGGSGNTFELAGDVNTPIIDAGMGNTVIAAYIANPLYGMPSNAFRTLTPQKGMRNITGEISSDFIRDGNPTTPYNWNDLFIWPKDFLINNFEGTNSYGQYYGTDPASLTGEYWTMPPETGFREWQQFYKTGTNLVVGTTIPATTATLYFSARCPANVPNLTFRVALNNKTAVAEQTFACTTSYQTYTMPINFGGQTGYIEVKNDGRSSSFYLSWMAFRPPAN